jgi:hypothetical protein
MDVCGSGGSCAPESATTGIVRVSSAMEDSKKKWNNFMAVSFIILHR